MASVIVTEDRKAEVVAILEEAGLDWFKCEPGFRFTDSDGAECLVVGWGGWRKSEPLGSIDIHGRDGAPRQCYACFDVEFMPATLVGTFLYKGEHHLFSIPDMEDLGRCQPWSPRNID